MICSICRRSHYLLFTDGSTRGQWGPSGIGFIIQDPLGNLIQTGCRYIGTATSTRSEYDAIISGLAQSLALGIRHITLHSDCQSIVQQIRNEAKTKNNESVIAHERVIKLIDLFDCVNIEYINRSQNQHADRLANKSVDIVREIEEIKAENQVLKKVVAPLGELFQKRFRHKPDETVLLTVGSKKLTVGDARLAYFVLRERKR